MKVLIATEKPFSKDAVSAICDVLAANGAEAVLLEKYTDAAQLHAAVAQPGIEGLIVRSDIVDAAVIDAAKDLKVIVRAGAGYDNIDLKAASAKGIVVENTPGQNANAVAELVIGFAIAAARNGFNGTTGAELRGKSLGLQAFGQVGRHVATIARGGFGMDVSAFDPFCPSNVMEEAGVSVATSVEDIYRNNRFVSIHIPATPQTVKSIGYDLVSLMPKGGVLINSARKEVIDEDGLCKALTERPDLKYYADVKPACAERMEAEFPGRVFFSPKKTGAQTAEANYNAGVAAARQVCAYLKDGVDRFRVN